MPSLLLLGVRHLGGEILDRFAERGYDVAAVSLSHATAGKGVDPHPHALVVAADVASAAAMELDAVEFLALRSPRGWTHELTITPAGDRWLS